MTPLVQATLWIGIDPSLTDSGIAWCQDPEQLGRICISSAHLPISKSFCFLRELFESYEGGVGLVFVKIEKPERGKGRDARGNTFSMAPVLSAIGLWEDCIKQLAPRRNTITKCTPSEWRKVVLGKKPSTGDWKQDACIVAQENNHNQADAWCILQYLIHEQRRWA